MRARALKGQTIVEFCLVLVMFIALTIGIFMFGIEGWQRVAVDHQIVEMGDTLPADWASYTSQDQKNALVKQLILTNSSSLDPDRLTVTDATISDANNGVYGKNIKNRYNDSGRLNSTRDMVNEDGSKASDTDIAIDTTAQDLTDGSSTRSGGKDGVVNTDERYIKITATVSYNFIGMQFYPGSLTELGHNDDATSDIYTRSVTKEFLVERGYEIA